MKLKKDTKAQVWSIDLIAGLTVFLLTIVLYFIFTNNMSNINKSSFSEIYNEMSTVSDTLMLGGSIENISNGEVGITNSHYRLNVTKLNYFNSMDYNQLKLLLKSRFEFLFFFEDRSGQVMDINDISYVGKPGITKESIRENEKPRSLILTRRFLIYDGDIITMVVYLWE